MTQGTAESATTPVQETYLHNFALLQKGLERGEPAWLQESRRAAFDRFCALGFPTTRDEDWRFTNVRPLSRVPFRLAVEAAGVSPQWLVGSPVGDLGVARAVFVNGRFAPALSALAGLPRGVSVRGLADVLSADPERVRPHLTGDPSAERHAFDALNSAFFRDGAFVQVDAGAVVEQPIHLLFVSAPDGQPSVSHVRTVVVAGAKSRATVVESYFGLDGARPYFVNPATTVTAGEGATLAHAKVVAERTRAFHVGGVRVRQQCDSTMSSLVAVLGGELVRNDLYVTLAGEGATATLHGLYLATGEQHVDNFTQIEHASANCSTREVYKGILDGASHAVFHGRIIVRPGAQNTDAKQTNNNLLLSPDARVNTKPQLEIYADQVKCTHGATIGEVDEDAIFYLRSRGIARDSAASLLTYAFASEILEAIRSDPLRVGLRDALLRWLPGGAALEAGPG
jgi:Fe-S cluster assembly protein SufD